jgi:hypothetical protein
MFCIKTESLSAPQAKPSLLIRRPDPDRALPVEIVSENGVGGCVIVGHVEMAWAHASKENLCFKAWW